MSTEVNHDATYARIWDAASVRERMEEEFRLNRLEHTSAFHEYNAAFEYYAAAKTKVNNIIGHGNDLMDGIEDCNIRTQKLLSDAVEAGADADEFKAGWEVYTAARNAEKVKS